MERRDVRANGLGAARRLGACLLLLAGGTGSAAAQVGDANIGRYRLTTGTSYVGDTSPEYATDGKVGPENSWVTGTRGRHRLNIFFERDTEIGQVHIYSGGDRDGAVDTVSVQYRAEDGSLLSVPGASVSGNTSEYLDIVFASPVTTTQLQLFIDDQTATIREVAVFPPLAQPKPIGDGVNMHLARQHRLPLTTASSTASGSSRRAVVDGFVNDADYWDSGTTGTQWIALDMQDPPETSPVTVRATTTPVEIGSVHLYSGLESGALPISRGRIQMLDDATGVWVDVPGGGFNNNTERSLAIQFDAPVVTAGLRLVVQSGQGIVREIVPLPPNGGQGWPIGTSVVFDDATNALDFDDAFYGIRLEGTGLSMQTTASGGVELRATSSATTQQYQILLNVGTDTYRIRNRLTGGCLEPQNGSLLDGAPVLETEYAGFPTQRWRMADGVAGTILINSSSGLALTAVQGPEGWVLEQALQGSGPQEWLFTELDHGPKKGIGGWPNDLANDFGVEWAYNWGPNDNFSPEIDFWPMQWGSFFWQQRPSLVPLWQRNGEPITLMGYNEPDKVDQSNIPVATAAAMWPRMEVQDLPLLGPAVAGHPATSSWIQAFMAEAAAKELRLDYVGMHSYGGPNPDDFMNRINSAANAWDRDVVVSEFSVVDWNNNNGWTDDPVYNWFAEVLWRMENNARLHKYAVFVFTDEPSNPISDNRGEMRYADGTLTPEGKLYAAWDSDTTIRTDTPYYLHNESTYKRIGAVPGSVGTASTTLGNRLNDAETFEWQLVPGSAPGQYRVESVADGRMLAYTSRGLELIEFAEAGTGVDEFTVDSIEHGWFALTEPGLGRRLRSSGNTIDLAPAGTTSTSVRWRFVPVYGGEPGAPRGAQAIDLGAGQVLVSWEPHGFRDLFGMTIYRQDPGSGSSVPVAADVSGESFVDQVPSPGTYLYSISAMGDTGESEIVSIGAVSVETCAADFNADFVVDENDISDAIQAIGGGLDYNGDGNADFFDVLDFLRVHDEGCVGG